MNSGTISNPKIWVPYMNTKDCSKGFCSFYCPQWCYMTLPPPQELPEQHSGTYFSPLVITIIGVLASAFLLVSYYAILSKSSFIRAILSEYCGNRSRTESNHEDANSTSGDNHGPSTHDTWPVTSTGLDEALIKSITVLKYNKGEEGLTNESNCPVCLTEFEDNESLRLLPKCSHVFHLPCIDTWLKYHSNCPLCRANVTFANASPQNATPVESHFVQTLAVAENVAISVRDEEFEPTDSPKSPSREQADLRNRDVVIEVRDDEAVDSRIGEVVSEVRDDERRDHVGSSDFRRVDEEWGMEETDVHNSRTGELNSSLINRVHSSGRLIFTKFGKAWNSVRLASL